jgi:ketosteroid isomerase-like protein
MHTMRMKYLIGLNLIVGVLLLTACHSHASRSELAQQNVQVVRQFTEAFNNHDVDAMLEFAHPDIEWGSVQGDTLSMEAAGHAELRQGMDSYFSALPSVRSSIESVMPGERFTGVRERASWESDGESKSQSSIAVYEIEDGRILRVTYFPAEHREHR